MAITNNIKVLKEVNLSDPFFLDSGQMGETSLYFKAYYDYNLNKYYATVRLYHNYTDSGSMYKTRCLCVARLFYGSKYFINYSKDYTPTQGGQINEVNTTVDLQYDGKSTIDLKVNLLLTFPNVSVVGSDGNKRAIGVTYENEYQTNQPIKLVPDNTAPTISTTVTPSHTSASLKWNSDIALKQMTAKIGNTTLYTGNFSSGTKSGTISLSKLMPNKTYTITLTGTRWNHTVAKSINVNVTTTSLPTVSSTVNFNIGSNLAVTLSKTFPLTTTLRVVVGGNNYNVSVPANTQAVTFSGSSYAETFYELSKDSKTLDVKAFVYYVGTNYLNASETVTGTSKTGTAAVVNSNPLFSAYAYGQSETAISDVLGTTTYAPNGYGNLNVFISVANKAVAKNHASILRYDYEIRDGSDTGTIVKNGTLPYYSDASVSANMGAIEINMNAARALYIRIRAVDSRGFVTEWVSKVYTIIPYEKPSATIDVHRLNNFEQEIVWSIDSYCYLLPVNKVNKNASYTIKTRVYDVEAGTWTAYTNVTNLITASTSTYLKRVTNVIDESTHLYALSREKHYRIEFTLSDSLYSTVYTFDINPGISIFGIHDDGHVTIGVLPDFDDPCLLQINSDVSVSVDTTNLKSKVDALF